MDALLPVSISILIDHIAALSNLPALDDFTALGFDTLYALYEIERASVVRKVYGYERLSADMKQAVKYRCEKCGGKEGSGLPEPARDMPAHFRQSLQGRTIRLTLHFLNHNRHDWQPVNIMVLCTTCAAAMEKAKAERYALDHKSIDNQVDSQVKKKSKPKKDHTETRKERIERQRQESGQQSFV